MSAFMKIMAAMTLCLLAAGCSDKEDVEEMYGYALELSFESESGENLVEGISTVNGSSAVKPGVCELEVVGVAPGWTYGGSQLHVTGDSGAESLLWAILPETFASDITMTLSSSHIFGNSDRHTIASHWTLQGNYTPVCDRLTFDGEPYSLYSPNPEAKSLRGVKITVKGAR